MPSAVPGGSGQVSEPPGLWPSDPARRRPAPATRTPPSSGRSPQGLLRRTNAHPWNTPPESPQERTLRINPPVEVVTEPEFQRQQAPELVSVVAPPFDVLVDQRGDGPGVEQAPGQGRRVDDLGH